jgi:hypothetical protein
MKAVLLALAFILPTPALGEAIPAEDAPYFVGETATVVGRARVQRMGSGEFYLDLSESGQGKGDGAPISAYVSRWNLGRFTDIVDLDGKLVAITGEIGAFRYRPEIFLTSSSQIAVVPPPAPPQPPPPQPLWIHIMPRGK